MLTWDNTKHKYIAWDIETLYWKYTYTIYQANFGVLHASEWFQANGSFIK